MDASKSTGQSSTANSLQPHDPRYKESTGINLSTPIDQVDKQRLRKDSVFANPDGQERLEFEDIHLTSSTNSPLSAGLTNFGPHDGLLVNDALHDSQRLQQLSCSSERRDSPQLNLYEGSGGSDRASLCPKLVLSEHDETSFDGLVLELEGMQLQQASKDQPHSTERATGLLSWKEDSIKRSDIPLAAHKPPPSVVTDLGDRVFYAELKEKRRKDLTQSVRRECENDLKLQDQFYEALVKPYEEKNGYFPRALLSSLVTVKCVLEELTNKLRETHPASIIREYARRICEECPQPSDDEDQRPPKIKSFKKIFVILVLIEKISSISKFLDEDVNDLDLPLSKAPKTGNGARFDLRRSCALDQSLECFEGWNQTHVTYFEVWQWSTVAPFFHKGTRKEVQHFLLPNSVMLPFKTDSRRDENMDNKTEIEGGFGCVFRVEIHQDHHNFDLPKGTRFFAVKRLNSRSTEAFKKEVEMLKRFSGDLHPHLISLLATYELKGQYYLVFPWAGGDLSDYWETIMPNPLFQTDTVRWVAKQCEGIADGLVKIHNYRTSDFANHAAPHEKRYGRHGDLKPENILWFHDGDGGTLKISDFGLSDFNTAMSKSYVTKKGMAWSLSYRPPECDLKDSKVGQSIDIWTLGCLYLEFITWLLGGWESVEQFAISRTSVDLMWYNIKTDTFFELVEASNSTRRGTIAAMVKPAVTQFIKDLHAHENCSEFVHDFLNMIELEMMIVKPIDPQERGRISSMDVHRKLADMLGKCKDPDYLCKSAPWHDHVSKIQDVIEVDITNSAPRILIHKGFRVYDGPIQERPLEHTSQTWM